MSNYVLTANHSTFLSFLVEHPEVGRAHYVRDEEWLKGRIILPTDKIFRDDTFGERGDIAEIERELEACIRRGVDAK